MFAYLPVRPTARNFWFAVSDVIVEESLGGTLPDRITEIKPSLGYARIVG
jgi:hypothetical protein